MNAIWDVFLLSIVVFAIAKFLPGIRVASFVTAIVVAVVYSVINFLLYKILFFITLPFVILSLGLFVFIINAFLLWLTDKLIEDFEISGIFMTIVAAFLITIGSNILRWIF